ncbi:MAG: DNA-deoxyinosine glycosylase [Lentisphaeria bacterium]|nr:DNA-deoxyinosine glycosylase [Lentisphaeria bacterium]
MSLRSFAPVAGTDARVLILGSMPGGESLRKQQYYAHPRNIFWRIMGTLFDFPSELPYEKRLDHLKLRHVALWDALAGCKRAGSLDSNIRDPEPNDIAGLLRHCPSIRVIFCNGGASYRFLKKYHAGLFSRPELEIIQLPSTSPAAALYSFEEKLSRWTAVREKAGLLD